jgi:hypothetical protein
MRPNKRVRVVFRERSLPKASAKVYDFAVRQTETSRIRRIAILERENALLSRMVSEIPIELERLRELLATP